MTTISFTKIIFDLAPKGYYLKSEPFSKIAFDLTLTLPPVLGELGDCPLQGKYGEALLIRRVHLRHL